MHLLNQNQAISFHDPLLYHYFPQHMIQQPQVFSQHQEMASSQHYHQTMNPFASIHPSTGQYQVSQFPTSQFSSQNHQNHHLHAYFPQQLPSQSPMNMNVHGTAIPLMNPSFHQVNPQMNGQSSVNPIIPAIQQNIPSINQSKDQSLQSSIQSTMNPTSYPSQRQSSNPTSNKSPHPTLQQSPNPSSNPTVRQSSNPTSNPSYNPSSNPSSNPTQRQSPNLSSNQTSNPTYNPTSNPTQLQSSNPTSNPSFNPSSNPTSNPTLQQSINHYSLPELNPCQFVGQSLSYAISQPMNPSIPHSNGQLMSQSITYPYVLTLQPSNEALGESSDTQQ